jgi:hypothetical protein
MAVPGRAAPAATDRAARPHKVLLRPDEAHGKHLSFSRLDVIVDRQHALTHQASREPARPAETPLARLLRNYDPDGI